jgi:Reverse transcriptase (RNA-dependent DNA polymerase)
LEWFKRSANKEADEQGSRASVSVQGLRRPTDVSSSTSANWVRTTSSSQCGFKNANLSLFFKKGDPTLVSNYRPISSMNTDCKMYTNLINNRLSPWAAAKLHQDQKGFVPGRYITEHTRLATEVCHLSSRLGRNGYLVSLDQSKAYDRVDQSLLTETLSCMGLPDELVGMISDVLHQPKTRVRINSGYSDWFPLRRGVRQGDPLSCLLYDFSIEPLGMRL